MRVPVLSRSIVVGAGAALMLTAPPAAAGSAQTALD